jgi:CRP-like cAMP-binding protein
MQIFSIPLPGELFAMELLFERHLHCSIDTIKSGCYRNFDRSQLRNAMRHSPSAFDGILTTYYNEKNQTDQLIVGLGRRKAAERVARLILIIWDRMDKLDLVENNRIQFPLRQTQIADETGLTNVYVNEVLNDFRDGGLIKFVDRSLEIVALDRLRHLAQAAA